MTKRTLVVLAIVATAFLLGHFVGKGDGKRDAENDNFRVIQAARADTIRLVEERRVVDTVRLRVAETKAAVSVAAFDSSAARIEAIADTSSVVPSALVIPEIQTCQAMQRDLLEEIDILKVNLADADLDTDLQTRRADLAEAQLKQQHHVVGFRSGLIVGAGFVLTVLHFAK